MTILLFGVSNVGKTASGEKLAQRLGYHFYDLDEVIKKVLQTTLVKNYERLSVPIRKA